MQNCTCQCVHIPKYEWISAKLLLLSDNIYLAVHLLQVSKKWKIINGHGEYVASFDNFMAISR